MDKRTRAMLIAACEAANNDPETIQMMKDFECTMADGIEELEREEAACGRTIASVFGPPPKI